MLFYSESISVQTLIVSNFFYKLKHCMTCFSPLPSPPTHSASNMGNFSRGLWMRLQSSKIRLYQLCIVGLLPWACMHMQHHDITLSAALFLETNGVLMSLNPAVGLLWRKASHNVWLCSVFNIIERKDLFFPSWVYEDQRSHPLRGISLHRVLAHMLGRCIMKAISGPSPHAQDSEIKLYL